ncbi:MAG: FAD-dependent oxidoreductase [SAR202 cluster bacterium]|jgi:thioredoxin reductase (NADPH)|nr:FAD-dependent oxidoreductase [SAR202 cluster bacterium]MDP6513711.1 FAD-dependent oxidoreductase [SAR202 cluster bacterium]MDP6715215.1 FAD-dependent oxidoreductase [SAR202 cluster bacterium]
MADQNIHYDALIIGQGASSYAAAMYAARYQMKPIIFGAIFGGETAIGGTIENYPGYPEIDGFELMMKFREQAEKYETPIVDENIVKAEKLDDGFMVTTEEGDTYHGTSIILGVGRERRTLGLEHEAEWTGRGVSYCATCDAPMHRGNTVAVVGGGDSAVKGAVLLGKYAEKVYIVYRQDRFTRPEPINLSQLEAAENVVSIFNAQIVELLGDDGLTGIIIDQEIDGSNQLTVDGVFIEIGADPRVELPNQLGLELNDQNEVIVDKGGNTNVEGVFAAGDLTNASGDLKQTITASAQGAIAATSAYDYVSEHADSCEIHAMGYTLVEAV